MNQDARSSLYAAKVEDAVSRSGAPAWSVTTSHLAVEPFGFQAASLPYLAVKSLAVKSPGL